jgi:hypothetical protein
MCLESLRRRPANFQETRSNAGYHAPPGNCRRSISPRWNESDSARDFLLLGIGALQLRELPAALIAQALADGIPLFISDVTFGFNRAKRSSGERRTEIWSSYPAEPLLIVDSCI